MFRASIEFLKVYETFGISARKVNFYDRISHIEHPHFSH
jgi:hypothetical protein